MPTQLLHLSPEAKQALLRKLKVSWAAYWVLFLAFIGIAGNSSQVIGTVALLVWLVAAIWLAAVVADAASSTGGSAFVWGCGTLFLGPLGALIFPLTQMVSLKK